MKESFVYLKFQKGRFEGHTLSYSYLQPYFGDENKIAPPPNYVVGVGMRINAADMDGDGRQDVVAGLYIFLNKGAPQRRRATNWLPARDSYPSHKPWEAPRTAAPMQQQPQQSRERERAVTREFSNSPGKQPVCPWGLPADLLR